MKYRGAILIGDNVESKLKEIKKSIEKLIGKLDDAHIYGVMEYLETALISIESAIEEYEEYISFGEE